MIFKILHFLNMCSILLALLIMLVKDMKKMLRSIFHQWSNYTLVWIWSQKFKSWKLSRPSAIQFWRMNKSKNDGQRCTAARRWMKVFTSILLVLEIFLIDGETSRITRDWDRRSWHAHIRLFDRSITLERDDDDGQKSAAALTLHTNPES